MHKLLFSLVAAALVVIPVQGSTVSIDFEAFPGPDGILGTIDDIPTPSCGGGVLSICGPIGDSFSTMGMKFATGTLFQGSLSPGSADSNHYVSSTPPDATFAFPVYGISILSYSYWSDVLYALDSSNTVIATDTLTSPTVGSAFFLGTLSLETTQPISRFTVLPDGCSIGATRVGACDEIVNLDNLVLTTASTSAAPEPSLLFPFCVGLAFVFVRRKRNAVL